MIGMSPDEIRQQYELYQYQSLREECAGARVAQHTILQWSQAVSGTLFAAALVAGATKSERFVIAAQFIFGLVIPAILLGGALAWAGEMIRMERTGMHMRSLERSVWEKGARGEYLPTSRFLWENLLWSPPESYRKSGFRKQNAGYAGVAIFFTMMFGGSLIAFCVLTIWWISLIVCVALAVLGVVVMVPSAIQIFSLGGTAPVLTDDELASWMNGLNTGKAVLTQSGTLQWLQSYVLVRVRGTRSR